MKNTNYKIICEEIESNNIILEDVITEGLIDNLKNMGKSALNGIANAANSMAEKFITGIASIFGKPKQNGSINKINSDVLAQKLSDNNIIKKLFGDKINEIINGCKSISKDELMSVMDDKKVELELEKLPDKKQEPVAESVFHNLDKLFIICEAEKQPQIDISKYEIEIIPGDQNPVKIKDKYGKEVTDQKQIQQITKQLLSGSSDTSNIPESVQDANEQTTDTLSANSQSAAQWVVDRGTKVLDIIQFPYNKEKLKDYIAKKIDSFSIVKDGKMKSKGAIFGVMLRWIGLIILIFMIANYAAVGGLVAAGGYMAARLGRKAISKIAMYGGKKYAEGVVSKADKSAKARL